MQRTGRHSASQPEKCALIQAVAAQVELSKILERAARKQPREERHLGRARPATPESGGMPLDQDAICMAHAICVAQV